MGAQYYARRGLALFTIQHLGRWGSAAVERYVAEALNARSAWAPLAAAEALDLSNVIAAANSSDAGPALPSLAGLVRQIVREECSRPPRARPAPRTPRIQPYGSGPERAQARGASGDNIPKRSQDRGDQSQEMESPPAPPPTAEAQQTLRAIASLVPRRDGREQSIHLVRTGGPSLQPCLWETHCGWKFGLTPFEARETSEVNCRKGCARAMGEVGLGGTHRPAL